MDEIMMVSLYATEADFFAYTALDQERFNLMREAESKAREIEGKMSDELAGVWDLRRLADKESPKEETK